MSKPRDSSGSQSNEPRADDYDVRLPTAGPHGSAACLRGTVIHCLCDRRPGWFSRDEICLPPGIAPDDVIALHPTGDQLAIITRADRVGPPMQWIWSFPLGMWSVPAAIAEFES
jgi:hypothetical protein